MAEKDSGLETEQMETIMDKQKKIQAVEKKHDNSTVLSMTTSVKQQKLVNENGNSSVDSKKSFFRKKIRRYWVIKS